MVVQFQAVTHLNRHAFAPGRRGFVQFVAGAVNIDDDAVAAAQVRHLAFQHNRRPANQGGVIQTNDVAGLEGAVPQTGFQQTLVHRHGPLHPGNSPHPVQFRVL